jgi:hypothetical protein
MLPRTLTSRYCTSGNCAGVEGANSIDNDQRMHYVAARGKVIGYAVDSVRKTIFKPACSLP